MKYFILFIVCLSLLLGCSNLDKAKEVRVIGQMKPSEQGNYHMYYFFENVPTENWEETETNEELRRQYEIYSSFDVPVGKLKVISFIDAQSTIFTEYDEVLGLEEFPTFMVLDNKGIVFRTTDANEILEFISTLPDIEYEE